MAKSLSVPEFAACVAHDPWRDSVPVLDDLDRYEGTEKVSFHLADNVKEHLRNGSVENYL